MQSDAEFTPLETGVILTFIFVFSELATCRTLIYNIHVRG